MNAKRLLVLSLMAIFATSAWAYDFSAVAPSGQTLYYNILDGGSVEVTSQDTIYPYYSTEPTGSLVIPESVTNGGNTYSVTSIGQNAFDGCSNLTTVTIPDGVTSIGSHAFFGCSGLTSVTIPDGVISIGSSAFSMVRHIEYHGSATGSPWDAISMNGVTDGYFVFSDSTKHYLLAYSGAGGDVTIPSTVVTIGSKAFYGCSGLTSVTIPDGVTSIGGEAFYGCSGLTVITIPEGVTSIGLEVFHNCSGLTSVTIPNSVISIGSAAFSGCSGLTSVTIPDDVTYIYSRAFSMVRHIEYHGSATGSPWGAISMNGVTDGDFVFSDSTKHYLLAYSGAGGDVTIPSTVDTIGNDAFFGCIGLTSVTIPDGVNLIGDRAFFNCSGLTSVTIGSGVTSVSDYAFENCSSLTSVTIGSGVTSIGSYAFYGCSGLTSVTIPDGVTSIGYDAFDGCSSLVSVTIPNSVTSIGKGAFFGCAGLTSVVFNADSCVVALDYNKNALFHGCSNIFSFTFGDSVRYIPYYICFGLTGLTSLTIGSGVTSIGNYAFGGCSGLTSVTIPDGVTSIGVGAFSDCSNLISVTIPNSVTSIGNGALRGCSGLTVMRMKPNTPPSLGDYSSICDNIIDLVVPHDSYAAYTNAGTNYTRHHIYCDTAFVTVNVNDTLRGQVVGEYDSYYVYSFPPDTITVSPIAYYGYHFARWEDNTTDDFRTITGITNDTVVTAYFDYNQYTITLATDSAIHGTVSGSGTYNYLSECTIRAMANNGYHFDHWSNGSTANPDTVSLVGDSIITAYFIGLTTTVEDVARGVATHIRIGDHMDKISATAKYGYHFDHWSTGSTSNPDTITLVNDSTITAFFAPNQYTVTGTANANESNYIKIIGKDGFGDGWNGGKLTIMQDGILLQEFTLTTGSIDSTTVFWGDGTIDFAWTKGQYNSEITFMVYDMFDSLLVSINNPNAGTVYTFTPVIFSSDNDMRGTVTGSATVDYLDTVTLFATANYGYYFSKWNDDNKDNPRHVVATGNIIRIALFDYNQYNITVQTDTSIHGTVYGAGTYNYLSECTISATANYGYHFTQWNDGVTDNPRTITLTQDTQFVAMFAKNTYTLTLQSDNNDMGIVNTTSVSGEYLDSSILIYTTPIAHYHFTQWNDGSTENPRRFVFDGDHTYTASFAIDVHTVGVQVDDLAHGSVSGASSREYGQPITVSATPYSGYQFTHWSNGSTYNPYTLAVLQDTMLTAIFAADGEPWQDTVVQYDTIYVDVHDTMYVDVHDTTYIDVYVHDTTYVYMHDTTIVRDTAYIDVPYTVHDTTIIRDTTYIDVPYAVHDTTIIRDTSYIDVLYAVHDTTIVRDTTYIDVPYAVHDTTIVRDTTYIDVPYAVHDTTIVRDTTYIDVPYAVHDTTIVRDTTYIDVPYAVHDTTIVRDTTYIDVPYAVHDTTIVRDTTYIDVPYAVHDTTYITLTDTVTNTVYDTVDNYIYDTVTIMQYDTVTNTVYDTVDNYIFDTVTNTVYDTVDNYIYDTVTVTDTLWLTRTDTLWLHDTVTVHDTVYVTGEGIDGAEALNAKVYSSHGQVVVEGAEGNTVALYDVNGRLLATKQDDYGTALHFDVTASGTYMIKIGLYPARKVVVIR